MSKSFDKILVRRIREVFDNHREPVDPDAWKDMERRLNQRSRLRVVYMRRVAGVAALLLVLMLVFRPFESRRDAVPSMEQVVQSEPGASGGARENHKPARANKQEERTGEGDTGSEKMAASQQQRKEAAQPQTTRKPDDVMRKGEEEKGKMLAAKQQGHQPVDAEPVGADRRMSKQPLLAGGISTPSLTPPVLDRSTETQVPEALPARSGQTGDDLVWENLSVPAESRRKGKPVDLEVEFSTLYNYSSSMIASEVNFAGGIISEFRVLPDLKLSTGLVVSRQYFTTRKQSRRLNTYLAANSSYNRTDGLASFNGNLADGIYPQFRDVSNKVKLVGLDVPVNIEYRMDNVSVSAGISSFAYLQEKYRHDFTSNYVVYEYDQANNITGTNKVARDETVRESYNPLGKMDLASVLNLAVGYHFDVGQTRLVVEPFMKHPLGDLASRDLRFGARGLRVRVGF